MRSIVLPLIALLLFVPEASAGLLEEHPEWFGYTAPLDIQGTVTMPAARGRIWIAPEIGDPWHADILNALGPQVSLEVLSRGPEQQLDLYAWMEDLGLTPSGFHWIDIEAVDTEYAGEWGPLVLDTGSDGDGAILLDGRYYSLRPNDDAAAGRIAAALDAPLHRLPLFLAGSQLQATVDGLCLVGPEIYSMNLGHTDAEIKYALSTYAGCVEVVPIPSPTDDLKKKPMDLYLKLTGARASAGDGEAWGVFLGDASSWSLSTQEGMDAIREVVEAAGGGGRLMAVDVPWPEEVEGALRSYLSFVLLDTALLLPTFVGVPEAENAMITAIEQELGAVEVRSIPSELPALFERYLSRLLGGGSSGAWAQVEPPVQLCAQATPEDCGLCLHECAEVEARCVDGVPAGLEICSGGADGCLDISFLPCEPGQLCEDGACKDPPTTCDTLPEGGICQGNVLVRCVAGQVIEVDCGQEFKLCAFEEDGTAACFTPCPESCQAGESTCGESAKAQLRCEVGPEGCLEWIEYLCPDDQICAEGACVSSLVDGQGGDAAMQDGIGNPEPDGPSVNAGFKPKDGCSLGTDPGTPWSTLLLLFLVTMLVLGRRTATISKK